MIIGSHVSMSGKDMLLGYVKEALSYGANTFMFYTGAPQNTRRKAISELKVEEAKTLMKENNIDLKNVVVHAPYIINLANTIKEETFELAVNFLKQELQRCQDIGTSILVLHPGSHVKAGEEVGLQQIIKGLNEVLFGIVSSADGETFSTNVNTTTVNTISANPNKVICPIIIAGIDTLKGYGQ